MAYTFGTGEAAASRLERIAGYFNPLAEQLIRAHLPVRVKTAVDLGCGPGFTTEMLRLAARADETIGLDSSEEFLTGARDRFSACRFITHDVTSIPFPVRADVIYVRFVLSHLGEPVRVVRDWLTQLNPGGVLVMEETEAVESEVAVFQNYLAGSTALVASGGARLFVGAQLGAGKYGARVLLNECAVLQVPDALAAAWFLPNTLSVWKTAKTIKNRFNLPQIEEISRGLEALIKAGSPESHITWKIRRIVLSGQ